jgi:hypothetical protein
MNERRQSHIAYYLERLAYWRVRKPAYLTARLLAARDADEAHPLRTGWPGHTRYDIIRRAPKSYRKGVAG